MAETVSRVYSNFRGADFRGEEINLVRSPDCVNVWKDYKETESIRTRPGRKRCISFSSPVYGLFFYRKSMIVHCGEKLYTVEDGITKEIYTGLQQTQSFGFAFEDKWYLKDGVHYLVYDGEEITDVVGYIPTTSIARKPAGGGTPYEDINMLSDYRKNSFLADGAAFDYFLDTQSIDADFYPEVTVDGTEIHREDYEVNFEDGSISFLRSAPQPPMTDGQDNVVITFKKAVPGYKDTILNCTTLQTFDNRVFFSGNSNHPNIIWHCSLNDPSYCSDLDYYREGVDESAIRGMVAGNNALWVFREPSSANTTVF